MMLKTLSGSASLLHICALLPIKGSEYTCARECGPGDQGICSGGVWPQRKL